VNFDVKTIYAEFRHL